MFVFGCGDNYKYSRDFKLTHVSEKTGETSIELEGIGGLQLADGSLSNDSLSVRKYMYGNMTIYYRLLYQRNSFGYDLTPQKITFIIDGQKYIMFFLGSDKSKTLEWAWLTVESPFLEKLAKAKNISLTIEGSGIAIDYTFNKKYLYFYKRFYKECVLTEK